MSPGLPSSGETAAPGPAHEENGRGILVLGMHRSGTSAVAGCVAALGLSPGPSQELMRPTAANEVGYWENSKLTRFNDELLRSLGGTWSGPPDLEPAWWTREPASSHLTEASSLLSSRFRDTVWVWKDPRLCLLLPFWFQVTAGPSILVVRQPEAVAASLNRRDGFPAELGLALWERYLRSAIFGLQGRPTLILHYEDLIEDKESALAQLIDYLLSAKALDSRPHPAQAAAFVRTDLRHHDDPSVHTRISSQAESIAYLVEQLGLASGPHGVLNLSLENPEPPEVTSIIDSHRAASVKVFDIEVQRSESWADRVRRGVVKILERQ